MLKPTRVKPSASTKPAPADVLAESIGSWVASQPSKPLVFALEHHYTERGLSLDLLKGADRQIADLVVAAARETNCMVHLSQVSRHLSQFADDGSFGESYSRHDRRSRGKIEIGETYEDEKHLLALDDRDTIALFLSKLADQDEVLRLSSFVVAACHKFGWTAFAPELKRLFSPRSDRRGRQEISFRDVEWLSAFCCDKSAVPVNRKLLSELPVLDDSNEKIR